MASAELLRLLTAITLDIRRQVAVLIERSGRIEAVTVGDRSCVPWPEGFDAGACPARLCGTRFLRTRLDQRGLDTQDLRALTLRRLDLVAAIETLQSGLPGRIHMAHISPSRRASAPYEFLPPVTASDLNLDFDAFVRGLEEELRRTAGEARTSASGNRAILCAVRWNGNRVPDQSLEETRELARTCGLQVVETTVQMRDKPDPKYLMGEGKLQRVLTEAVRLDADTLLIQQNLSPNQARHLSDACQLKVLDRTQLILDIFAQRATSHDGKLQVELAQLRYLLPRMREWDTGMSRLVGGIGGRGPGETKLEIHRRRARERMNRLEREISALSKKRAQKRRLRTRRNVPVVSIVGYTNAGKSTLLNSLTDSKAFVEDKLFATLDPFSKRLRFPRDREIVLTDTVGFIADLPSDLIAAFRATLEEIGQADLLLHVVDLANPGFEGHIDVVNALLKELGYGETPQSLVLNKTDLVDPAYADLAARRLGARTISALRPETCLTLLSEMEARLWK